jgi:hypothetical protein
MPKTVWMKGNQGLGFFQCSDALWIGIIFIVVIRAGNFSTMGVLASILPF